MPENRKPITVLTGFLGSGKTTVLNQLLSSPELAETAVLINEFGEIALDHLLVSAITDDIVLLESGCVCCSVLDDFSATLLTLHDKREKENVPAFRKVILETTGIADPAAVHQLIISDSEIMQRYQYSDTITVVDAVYGQQTLDKHIEAVKQVSIADQLLISKTDIAESSSIRKLETRLSKINPIAPTIYAPLKDSDISKMLKRSENIKNTSAEINSEYKNAQVNPEKREHTSSIHDHRFTTFHLTCLEALNWDDFVAWLEALLIARGDSIHRLKGFANIIGKQYPVVIQGVQHSLYPPGRLEHWPQDKPMTELVFITSDFPKEAAVKSFTDVLNVSVK